MKKKKKKYIEKELKGGTKVKRPCPITDTLTQGGCTKQLEHNMHNSL